MGLGNRNCTVTITTLLTKRTWTQNKALKKQHSSTLLLGHIPSPWLIQCFINTYKTAENCSHQTVPIWNSHQPNFLDSPRWMSFTMPCGARQLGRCCVVRNTSRRQPNQARWGRCSVHMSTWCPNSPRWSVAEVLLLDPRMSAVMTSEMVLVEKKFYKNYQRILQSKYSSMLPQQGSSQACSVPACYQNERNHAFCTCMLPEWEEQCFLH